MLKVYIFNILTIALFRLSISNMKEIFPLKIALNKDDAVSGIFEFDFFVNENFLLS